MSIQEGEIGAPIVATVKNADGTVRNISNATVKQFIWRSPDGIKTQKDVEFLNDGNDGKLIYWTAEETDSKPYGVWRLQSYTEQPPEGPGLPNRNRHSKVASYYVLNNI